MFDDLIFLVTFPLGGNGFSGEAAFLPAPAADPALLTLSLGASAPAPFAERWHSPRWAASLRGCVTRKGRQELLARERCERRPEGSSTEEVPVPCSTGFPRPRRRDAPAGERGLTPHRRSATPSPQSRLPLDRVPEGRRRPQGPVSAADPEAEHTGRGHGGRHGGARALPPPSLPAPGNHRSRQAPRAAGPHGCGRIGGSGANRERRPCPAAPPPRARRREPLKAPSGARGPGGSGRSPAPGRARGERGSGCPRPCWGRRDGAGPELWLWAQLRVPDRCGAGGGAPKSPGLGGGSGPCAGAAQPLLARRCRAVSPCSRSR